MSSTLQKSRTNRKLHLDFLRIIAIFMVLFNHTNQHGFVHFTVAQDSVLYPFYLFSAHLIKIAVPLFFMISGALLLGKEESFKDLLIKRFLKYLIVLTVASIILYVYFSLQLYHKPMSVSDFLKGLYSGKITLAYWYLYAYLAFILMLPLLRKLARGMADRDFKWVLLLCTLVGLLELGQYRLSQGSTVYNTNFSLFAGQNYILYPLMGYYIEHRLKAKAFRKRNLLLLWAIALGALLLSCYMTHYMCTITNGWTEAGCQSFMNTLIFLPSIAVFYTAKLWFTRHTPGKRISKAITTLGGLTFGIYLMEGICRVETKHILPILRPYVHTFPACIIWILCACVFGGVCIFILKLIPGVKKWI